MSSSRMLEMQRRRLSGEALPIWDGLAGDAQRSWVSEAAIKRRILDTEPPLALVVGQLQARIAVETRRTMVAMAVVLTLVNVGVSRASVTFRLVGGAIQVSTLLLLGWLASRRFDLPSRENLAVAGAAGLTAPGRRSIEPEAREIA